MDDPTDPIGNRAVELAEHIEAGLAWAKANKVRIKRGDFVQYTEAGLCAVCLLTAAYCAANNKTWGEAMRDTEVNDCIDVKNPIYKWALQFGHVYHFKPAYIPQHITGSQTLGRAVIDLFDFHNWTSTRVIKWLKGMVPA